MITISLIILCISIMLYLLMIIYDQDKTEHTDISSIGDRYDRVYSDKLHEQEDAIHNNTITHWDNMPNNKEIEWTEDRINSKIIQPFKTYRN